MTEEGSVTHWFRLLEQGDHAAAQPLWERYFTRLEGLARKMLQGRAGGLIDAEDIALSAFDSMSRGLQRGRFAQLEDRDNLWKLLVVITARKVFHQLRYQQAQKRGGGKIGAGRITVDPAELEQVIGEEPTPEFAVQAAEEYQRLLAVLNDEELEQVAVLKMEGYTHREIATRLKRSPRSVARKLRLIRRLWEQEAE